MAILIRPGCAYHDGPLAGAVCRRPCRSGASPVVGGDRGAACTEGDEEGLVAVWNLDVVKARASRRMLQGMWRTWSDCFRMAGVMHRPLPDLPWVSAFPELNVRLYVERDGKPGVWFLSLKHPSWPPPASEKTQKRFLDGAFPSQREVAGSGAFPGLANA